MDRLVRMVELFKAFDENPTPSSQELEERLECSRFTLYRLTAFAKERLGMPIGYNRPKKLYELTGDINPILPLPAWKAALDSYRRSNANL